MFGKVRFSKTNSNCETTVILPNGGEGVLARMIGETKLTIPNTPAGKKFQPGVKDLVMIIEEIRRQNKK